MSGYETNKIQEFAKQLFRQFFMHPKQEEEKEQPKEETGNPFLFEIREIMEQILEKRKISYDRFAPVLIDGEDSKYALRAAELLGRDLNRITIWTDRPAYFDEYADNMYAEQGLIAEVFPKNRKKIAELSEQEFPGNVILDFEAGEEGVFPVKFRRKIYIPVFKRKWERFGNLDIAVPIGYNTVIVRGSEMTRETCYPDRFERAFYENE